MDPIGSGVNARSTNGVPKITSIYASWADDMVMMSEEYIKLVIDNQFLSLPQKERTLSTMTKILENDPLLKQSMEKWPKKLKKQIIKDFAGRIMEMVPRNLLAPGTLAAKVAKGTIIKGGGYTLEEKIIDARGRVISREAAEAKAEGAFARVWGKLKSAGKAVKGFLWKVFGKRIFKI